MSNKSKSGVSIRDGDKSVQFVREEAPIIPPADQLERYEHILPGMAERMLTMAEKQQTHRLEGENKAEKRNHFLAVCGQWIIASFGLCFVGIAAAGVFTNNTGAVYLGGAAMVCIIALSAISRKK